MGRRRLALRQIEEREDAAASDAESDGALDRPRFDLLGPSAAPAASAALNGAERRGNGRDPQAASVFALYQDGPAPELPLQLAFVRRRAPRALRDARVKVEDEFVAPRPALTLSDVVPSATDVPLEKLWVEPASMAPGSAGRGEVAPLLDEEKRARAMESAAKLLSCPGRATEEDVERWRALAECDWREALQQAQEGEDQAGESEGSHGCGSLRLPSAADLCLAIECCRSEALAQFVWEDLLEPLVDRAVFGSSEPKQSSDSSSLERHAGEPTPLTGVRRLLAAVVRHSSFARMEPRRFRALVRARNLRQVDEVVGAQLELELVALFQRQRQLQQLQPQRQVAGSCHHGDAETARMSLGECHCAEGTCSSAASPPSRSSWRRGAAR